MHLSADWTAQWTARWKGLQPESLYRLAGALAPWALAIAAATVVAGLVLGLNFGSWDQRQLAMLHVPATWVTTLLLLSAAFWAAIARVFEQPVAHTLVHAIVPTGGMFAFLSLWSGALWTKAVHGVWWLGSSRELAGIVLLAVYLLLLCLPVLLAGARRVDRAASSTALAGMALTLLVFFAGAWRGDRGDGFAMAGTMVPAMLLVAAGLWAYATFAACLRLRCILLERQAAPTAMVRWS